MVEIKVSDTDIRFGVHVTPGAKRNLAAGAHDQSLRVSVTAPPDKGKANDLVVEVLAKALGVKRSQCEILSGHTSRRKVVRIQATNHSEIIAKIESLANPTE